MYLGPNYVAKTKGLISCAVTAQLICVFVFTYAKACFLMTQLICKKNFFSFISCVNKVYLVYLHEVRVQTRGMIKNDTHVVQNIDFMEFHPNLSLS